jgi:hypothetical protein
MRHEENCLIAMGNHMCEQVDNDDDVARIDTMCTLTMHGEQWSKIYGPQLHKIGLIPRQKNQRVLYCFGGGEKKISTVQEVFPIGIGGINGEITSQCIQDSPTPLLLSLDVQCALGMVLNIQKGTADFTELDLYNVRLVQTREGGLGVRIAEFCRRKGSRFWKKKEKPNQNR